MANKKLTWKNLVVNVPVATKTVELDEAVFGAPSIEVKHTLNMDEASAFVADIVNMCIDEDEAEYTPEFFDFANRLCVLCHYAGIPLPSGKDGAVRSMAKTAYYTLYETDLYSNILTAINFEQYQMLICTIALISNPHTYYYFSLYFPPPPSYP